MSTFTISMPSLVIASGAASSNVLSAEQHYEDAVSIYMHGPASLDALTFTIEMSHDGSSWATYSSGGSDVGPAGAVKATIYYDLPNAPFIRLKASGNVAATRTWILAKNCKLP